MLRHSLTRAGGSLLLALALLAPAGPSRAAEPYEINVLLSETASGAFLGNRMMTALHVLEKVTNAHGGIHGRPIHFAIQDDQTNPVTAVQLTNALIAKHVPVILGSSLSATCSAMEALVAKDGPVEYCFSPIISGPAGGYLFSSSAGSDSIAAGIVRFYRESGWTNIAVMTSTDASGLDFERQLNLALAAPENRSMHVLAREHFAPADLSVSAQIANIKAAKPQALLSFATGTPFGTVLHAFFDAGLTMPISTSGGNMIYEQMAQYKAFTPRSLYFPTTRGDAPNPKLRPGPIKDAQTLYFSAFAANHERPDHATGIAWDPASIVVEALRKLPPDPTPGQLRAYLENLHGYAGINGIYDFRDGSQRGIGKNSVVIYRWDVDKQRPDVVSGAAGHVE